MSIFPLDSHVNTYELNNRRDELREERDAITEKIEDFRFLLDDSELTTDERDAAHNGLSDTIDELAKWDSDNSEEFSILVKVCEDGSNYIDDWDCGTTLIHEDEMDDYIIESVKDSYSSRDVDWKAFPFNCMDWKQVVKDCIGDYTVIEIDGETYYAR